MKYEDHRRSKPQYAASGAAFLLLTSVFLVQSGHRPSWLMNPWISGVVVSGAFALLARWLHAVSVSGAITGALVSYLLYAFAGRGAFVALVGVFVLTWISTQLGHARKLNLGKAERRGGRAASQVLANLAVPALCAAALPLLRSTPNTQAYFRSVGTAETLLLVGLSAGLSEAAADTVSSECGVAWSDKVRLITIWKPVPPGTDGGVSAPGTLAGAIAALAVAGICRAVRLISLTTVPIVAGTAVLGMMFDSLLGATLEQRQIVGNNTVNFLSTAFAALAAMALSLLGG